MAARIQASGKRGPGDRRLSGIRRAHAGKAPLLPQPREMRQLAAREERIDELRVEPVQPDNDCLLECGHAASEELIRRDQIVSPFRGGAPGACEKVADSCFGCHPHVPLRGVPSCYSHSSETARWPCAGTKRRE